MPGAAQSRINILSKGEIELLPATHHHHPCASRMNEQIVIKDDQSGQAVAYSVKEFEVVMAAIPRILTIRGTVRKHFNDAHVRFGIERVFDAVTLFRQNGGAMESIEMDISALKVLSHCQSLIPR